jgi:hypothetical protein
LPPILWWIERIVITDKRVMLAQGFFVHKIAMMPLTKVTDLTFERSIRGRLLGYGTLIVESAGLWGSRTRSGPLTCGFRLRRVRTR